MHFGLWHLTLYLVLEQLGQSRELFFALLHVDSGVLQLVEAIFLALFVLIGVVLQGLGLFVVPLFDLRFEAAIAFFSQPNASS